ncbi:FAD-dependent oxidoreductase [Pantoea sp. YR343]|uniref:NAD(P)/FAD-dependent oxidoreductase n=1 Tax=Pantoea sp. YR343 TaxID=1144341 RepID=UPI000271150F|nr:FAD-dependent oxidoreductase [Pantoea sp. YR343]KAJ9431807.1 FAD-dependent oxidoreductase [Pantoea sp. YR343]
MTITIDSSLSADLIVIGGGIHGCSAALHAALLGMKVIILEKDSAGRHSSGVNAGGVRRQGREFAEIPLSDMAMKMWYDIENFLDDDCGFNIAPQIEVAETEMELEEQKQRASDLRAMGYEHEVMLDYYELREHLPGIAEHALGGIACLLDGYAQPYQTTLAFKRKAQSCGVRILEDTQALKTIRQNGVWQVDTHRGTIHAPMLLNAAGAWGADISGLLGEPVPINVVAPMMIVTARLPHFCNAVVGAAGRPLSFKQMPNGTVVIGGGRRGRADRTSNKSEILFDNLSLSADTACSLFPIMRNATIVRTWSGIEGWLPDYIPIIGPSAKHEGLYHSFAFCSHGFQLAPAVGKVMGELIATGKTNMDLSAFSISRFTLPLESH